MRKVVIVGNSPNLLKRKNGLLIDSFDEVVRMNHYETKGFEEFVGCKTDVYGVAWATPHKKPYDWFKKVIHYTGQDNLVDYEPSPNEWCFKLEDYEKMNNILGFEKETSQPSMGFAMIYYYLEHEVVDLSIIGFDFFGLKDNSSTFGHYYEKKKWKRKRSYEFHEPDKEKEVIELLNKEGVITILD